MWYRSQLRKPLDVVLRGQDGGNWASGCNAKGINKLHSIDKHCLFCGFSERFSLARRCIISLEFF